jgi:hypothetical protein
MDKYLVGALFGTAMWEEGFNAEYHKKYISKVGEEVDHYYRSGTFTNFKLLVFEKDEKGSHKDADWFHVSDLIKVDE